MFKKDELIFLWPFYLSSLLKPGLTSAYAVVYLVTIGLSFTQIGLLMAVNCIVHVICDIPTGAIADIYGRKASVIMSYVASGILFIMVPLSTDFYYLLILFIIWGVTQTLETGADEAWVVSNLRHENKKGFIEVFFAKVTSIRNFGLVFWPLIAALIVASLGIAYVWTFQGIFTLLTVMILLFAGEHFKTKKTNIKRAFRNTISHAKQSMKYSANHQVILRMVIAVLFIWFVAAGAGLMWQPYMVEFGFPLEWFGILLSIGGVVGIFVPVLSAHIANRFSKKSRYLALLLFIQALIFIAIVFVNSMWVAAVIVTLLFLGMEFVIPVEGPLFHRFLPEKMRASIGSLKSTVGVLGAGVVMILAGVSADIIGPVYTLAALAVFLVPPILLYLNISRKHKEE